MAQKDIKDWRKLLMPEANYDPPPQREEQGYVPDNESRQQRNRELCSLRPPPATPDPVTVKHLQVRRGNYMENISAGNLKDQL